RLLIKFLFLVLWNFVRNSLLAKAPLLRKGEKERINSLDTNQGCRISGFFPKCDSPLHIRFISP
ncbi:MAG: hypothetical protein IJC71_06805, partial [Clostridia bacterium]|nr:hypothetical protein [Clostridia bacterium]